MVNRTDQATMAEVSNIAAGSTSRRRAIGLMGAGASAGLLRAALPAAASQAAVGMPLRVPTPPPAVVPRADLVDVFEYEAQARLALGSARMAPIAGSDRSVTDRITLRPRMNIPTRDLDMTSSLFGDPHFAPIIVGPVANQKRFHQDGELATARGASAAKAAMVVSSDASVPLATIAQAGTAPVWLQVYAHSPKVRDVLAEAVAAQAKAVIVTVNGRRVGRCSRDPGVRPYRLGCGRGGHQEQRCAYAGQRHHAAPRMRARPWRAALRA